MTEAIHGEIAMIETNYYRNAFGTLKKRLKLLKYEYLLIGIQLNDHIITNKL